MGNQLIQKIIPEYLARTELWDSYSRRDQDGNESELCYFTETGYLSCQDTDENKRTAPGGLEMTGKMEAGWNEKDVVEQREGRRSHKAGTWKQRKRGARP